MAAQWNARPWLGILLLTNNLDIAVEVSGRHILVSAPRVGFRAVYTEAPDFPELVLEMEWLPNSKVSPVDLGHLRARAWRLANETATALGWFKDV